jgi:NADH-quinone oxidoreductase subunit M
MTAFQLPWLEIAVGVPLLAAGLVSLVRNRLTAVRAAAAAGGLAFVAAFLAWLGQYLGVSTGDGPLFRVDELSGPLVPAVALLHFLTAATASKRKAGFFNAAQFLLAMAVRLAVFACTHPWLLVALLLAAVLPPYLDLKSRGRPTRVYVFHMVAFAALLASGWALVSAGVAEGGAVLLVLAVLVRSGVLPAHVWIPDLFERGSLSATLLTVGPLTGVYAAVRLAVPVAPAWLLTAVTALSLVTAVYSAGVAVVQIEVRRFVAHLFVSFASLVLIGLEVHTTESVTGALALWFSLMVAATGLGLVVRAVEDRYGRLSLNDYHGLYDRTPLLAIGFLVTGLACVGFPGTIGFVSAELLIDGTVEHNPWVGVVVVVVSALNGVAVLRAFWRLYTGRWHATAADLPIAWTERAAVLVLCGMVIGGGLFPQPGLASRAKSAQSIMNGLDPLLR